MQLAFCKLNATFVSKSEREKLTKKQIFERMLRLILPFVSGDRFYVMQYKLHMSFCV